MNWQKGYYEVTGPDTVSFVVEDWEPKNQAVYHTYPYDSLHGGYWVPEQRGAVGGTYRIEFTSSDSFTMQTVDLGDMVFARVR